MGLKMIVIGAGLGGLTCAIACAQQGLEAVVLERAPEILPVGAGIQIPPNAARVMSVLGLLPKLLDNGAVVIEGSNFRRYQDGKLLGRRPAGDEMVDIYGSPWLLIHREDYHRVLIEEAERLGVKICLGHEASKIDFEKSQVALSSGEVLAGDVIIGADGLWSVSREQLLGHPSPPIETGDLAYRGTFSLQQLLELKDPLVEDLCLKKEVNIWLGPEAHSTFYPVKGGQQWNLVLLRPDNLPQGTRTAVGDLKEMSDYFKDWDPALRKVMSCLSSALKWKLCHHSELSVWTKNNVALLGDSCHPTLPYQAQGAAMAVGDGLVLAILLGQASQKLPASSLKDRIPSVLQLYERLQKSRSTANVLVAINSRNMFHLPDGPAQESRDEQIRVADWRTGCSEWYWLDSEYQKTLLGYDIVDVTQRAFDEWYTQNEAGQDKSDNPAL